MPARIAAVINAEGSQNKLTGVVPALASLLKQDRRVETAYICHDETTQVYNLPGEGNHFCGYRNIQMLLLQEQRSIIELQDMIERAWNEGYNPHSRIETGGISGTRKHIGTSEVVL
jgi:zinc finger-containing ubiquitin peptidase 1